AVRHEPRPEIQLALGQEVERDRLDVPLLVDPLDAVLVRGRDVGGLPERVAIPDERQVDPRARDQAVRGPRASAGDLRDLEAPVASVTLELDDAVAAVPHRLEDAGRLARQVGIPPTLGEGSGAEPPRVLAELSPRPDGERLPGGVEIAHAPPQLAVRARH